MDPVTDSGGRVTRSLRKRISSVDGDNSSRPGTPVPSKLTAITEISSPSWSNRITRRNSISGVATPVKTPAKRGVDKTSTISETVEAVTPARRSSRRQSVSINEGDERPQVSKTLNFSSLIEEEERPAETNESKSSKQIKSSEKRENKKAHKRQKPGPKCMTRKFLEETEDLSDVDVFVVDSVDTVENILASIVTNTNDIIDCDDEPQELNNPTFFGDKSPKENEEKDTSTTNVQKAGLKVDDKNTSKISATIIDVINVDDDKSNHLNNSKLCVDKSPKENDATATSSNSPVIFISESRIENVQKAKINVEEKNSSKTNISIIDLMECDDEPRNLDNSKTVKSPKKNNETATYSASKLENMSDQKTVEETPTNFTEIVTDKLPNVNNETAFVQDESNVDGKPSTNTETTATESIIRNFLHLDNINLCADKSPKENETPISTNSPKLLLSESKKETAQKAAINIEEKNFSKTNISIIDLMECDDEPQHLDNCKLGTDKLPNANNETAFVQDESNVDGKPPTNIETTATESIIRNFQHLDNINLCADKSPKENETPISSNSPVIFISESRIENVQKAKINIEEKNSSKTNISIIDLMECDNEPGNLDNSKTVKSPKKNNETATSSASKLENMSDQKTVEETPTNLNEIIANKSIRSETNQNNLQVMNDFQKVNEICAKDTISSDIHSNHLNCTSPHTQKISSIPVIDDIDGTTPQRKTTAAAILETTEHNLQEMHNFPKANEIVSTDISASDLNSNDLTRTPSHTQKMISNTVIDDITCTKPQPTVTIINVIQISSPAATACQAISDSSECKSTKKVEFISGPNADSSIKSVYPKTPALMKTKSFIGTEEESSVAISAEKKVNDPVTSNKDKKESYFIEIEKELKWINPSVRANTAEGCKLDVVKPIQTPEKLMHETKEGEEKFKIRKENAIVFSSDSNDEGDEGDDEEAELAPGEKPHTRKHAFHVDEAMEVDYYESGDSMDSEERREILENEIHLDGESIGSNTTDDAHDDYVDGTASENDSFIVSDNEEEENVQLEYSDSDDEDDIIDYHDRKKQKSYKRIQQLPAESESTSSSSSLDERKEGLDNVEDALVTNHEDDLANTNDKKKQKSYKRIQQRPTKSTSSSSEELDEKETAKETQTNNDDSPQKKNNNRSIRKSSDNSLLDSSKLSDTALRLQCTAESESEELDEDNENISRKEILQKLNQSDRFNKSVRDLNPEGDTSPMEYTDREQSIKVQTDEITANTTNNKNEINMALEKSMAEEENDEKIVEEENDDEESCASEDSTSFISADDMQKSNRKANRDICSESHLGEVSVTPENDNDKENGNKNKSSSNPLRRGGLSVSFGNSKKSNNHSPQRSEWQRSFTIGVSVKGADLGTAVAENISSNEINLPSTSSSNVDQGDELSSDDARYLGNMHMPLPLGNPLVRTRRQSLALPTNPDMEIFSSSHAGGGANKKPKRKSLGVLSRNEFNPSQSFIDSMELRKNEFDRQATKRKRLSKSFCGASESLENSIIDIDVRHLHKRSKFSIDKSIVESHLDSIENINTSKLYSKASLCSTPREKPGKSDSNNNIERILSRCDEILEAANRAKFEAKINSKKSNTLKLSKRNKKKPSQQSIRELHRDEGDAPKKTIAKENKYKDKIKAAALTQALKAADHVILGKKKQLKAVEEDAKDSKYLSRDVLEAIAEVKKNKRDTHNDRKKLENCLIISTTAGNFMEMPQTPEKKKKRAKIIQLPSGKVSVEPVTPKKRSVLASNGSEFRESPITPFAVGFKVRQIPSGVHDGQQGRKRKRNFDEPPQHTLPKSQWTQSGLFIEEEIARSEVSQLSGLRKIEKRQTKNAEKNANWNFKENAIMRSDVKRSSAREILQLKERRYM